MPGLACRETEEGELTATINLDPQSAKDRSKLEVRWRTSPEELSKDAVEIYHQTHN